VALGATVKEVESKGDSLGNAAAAYAQEHDHYFLNDASDELVPVGTATIAAEILDELPAVDVLVVPMGDTALIRGVAAEAKRRNPEIKIVGVQATQAPSYVRSWHEGRVVTTDTCDTIADGLATCVPREPNVRAIRELVDEVCLVSEEELLQGIRTLLFEEHVVAEAAGAATTAAYLQNPTAYAGGTVVLLVTGSSIPHELLRRVATSR
jgi:threonine dehydratase